MDQQRTNQQRSNSERLDLQDGPRSLKCYSDMSSSDLETVPDVVLTATSSQESPHNLEVQCEPTTKAKLEPEKQDTCTSSNKNVSELSELYNSAGIELSDIALDIPLSQQIPYTVVSNFNNENVLTINDTDISSANESPDTDGEIERSSSPDWKKFSHPDLRQSPFHEHKRKTSQTSIDTGVVEESLIPDGEYDKRRLYIWGVSWPSTPKDILEPSH